MLYYYINSTTEIHCLLSYAIPRLHVVNRGLLPNSSCRVIDNNVDARCPDGSSSRGLGRNCLRCAKSSPAEASIRAAPRFISATMGHDTSTALVVSVWVGLGVEVATGAASAAPESLPYQNGHAQGASQSYTNPAELHGFCPWVSESPLSKLRGILRFSDMRSHWELHT